MEVYGCGCFRGSWVQFVVTDEFSVRITKITSRISVKDCKPNNFKRHNSLKLSFAYIRGFRSKLVECESFLESNSPDILALHETKFHESIDSGNFPVRGFLPLI